MKKIKKLFMCLSAFICFAAFTCCAFIYLGLTARGVFHLINGMPLTPVEVFVFILSLIAGGVIGIVMYVVDSEGD